MISVNEHGVLVRYNSLMRKHLVIKGVEVTELWGDAYKLNMNDPDQEPFLFPVELEQMIGIFTIVENREKINRFRQSGGGFRLDFATQL